MEKFEQFKAEILRRAKTANACAYEYKAAATSQDFAGLFVVIKRNFAYCCNNVIIDGDLIESVKAEAAECDVWCNESVNCGFLLATGSATVMAYGSATVRATDNATVRASGSATVMAYGSATVMAYGSAYISVRSDMDCKISDHAIMRFRDTNEVVVCENAKVTIIK